MDGFCSRDGILSSPGGAYLMYEPRPINDQTTRQCFHFRLKLEPEILKCQTIEGYRVLYLQEQMSDVQQQAAAL